MQQFKRLDPISGQNVNVVLHDNVTGSEQLDDYVEVSLVFADGKQFRTAFWPDPQSRGHYWIEQPGMVIAPDLSPNVIIAAVDDLMRKDQVGLAFEVGTTENTGH